MNTQIITLCSDLDKRVSPPDTKNLSVNQKRIAEILSGLAEFLDSKNIRTDALQRVELSIAELRKSRVLR